MAGIVVCLAVAAFTSNKLHQMSAIRGWVSGAHSELKTITGKLETTDRGRSVYWIAFDNRDPGAVGDHRLNIEQEQWTALSVGDALDVRYLDGDTEPFLESGIFVSDGNFIFDLVLLAGELGGAVLFTVMLVMAMRTKRR